MTRALRVPSSPAYPAIAALLTGEWGLVGSPIARLSAPTHHVFPGHTLLIIGQPGEILDPGHLLVLHG